MRGWWCRTNKSVLGANYGHFVQCEHVANARALRHAEHAFRHAGGLLRTRDALLHEYRTALISAAVTGQIDASNPKAATRLVDQNVYTSRDP